MYFLSFALFALNAFILDGLGGYVLNKRHFSDLLFFYVDERIHIFEIVMILLGYISFFISLIF